MPYRTFRTSEGYKQMYIPESPKCELPAEENINNSFIDETENESDASITSIKEVPPLGSEKEFFDLMRKVSITNLHLPISVAEDSIETYLISSLEDIADPTDEDKSICIYLASHVKDYIYPDIDIYKAIQVGAAIHEDLHLPFRDDTGDNISEKNPYYCELTAYYWVWKNATEDIVGVGHYRRIPVNPANKLYSKEELIDILSENDFIIPGRVAYKEPDINYYERYKERDTDIPGGSTYAQYMKCHSIIDMDLAWYAIKEKYPEYEEDFVNQIVFGKLFVPCNILIAPKQIFDGFCEWLFDILFFVEKYSPYKTYDNYNKRAFGFLAERLFALYFFHNKLKCQNCSTIDLKEVKDE